MWLSIAVVRPPRSTPSVNKGVGGATFSGSSAIYPNRSGLKRRISVRIHSSSLRDGHGSSANRAQAASRLARSHDGSLRESSSERNVSSLKPAAATLGVIGGMSQSQE